MPFLTLEISPNLINDQLVECLLVPAVNEVAEALAVPASKVKSQIVTPHSFMVGSPGTYEGFAFFTLACFADRPGAVKRSATQRLIKVLQDYFVTSSIRVKLAAYIIELDRDCTFVAPLEEE